jgi:TrmH family RNA methyltransferase
VIVRALDDPHNKVVRHVRHLLRSRHARERAGQAVLEGPHLALEAARAGIPVRAVLYAPRLFLRPDGEAVLRAVTGRSARTVYVTDRLLDHVCEVETHQGIVTVVEYQVPWIEALEGPCWLLTDGVQDPGNLGTVVRSAAAFGFRVGLLTGTVDVTNPKVIRASAGGVFRARPVFVADPFRYPPGFELWIADPDGRPYTTVSWRPPLAIVVGNEGAGVRERWSDIARGRVAVPMAPGVDSVNVAVAASILMAAVYQDVAGRDG